MSVQPSLHARLRELAQIKRTLALVVAVAAATGGRTVVAVAVAAVAVAVAVAAVPKVRQERGYRCRVARLAVERGSSLSAPPAFRRWTRRLTQLPPDACSSNSA